MLFCIRNNSRTNSTKCDAGEAGTGKDGMCTACDVGRYRNASMTAANCSICPAGWSSIAGSTKCQLCEPGKYSGVVGGEDCEKCDVGQYRTASMVIKTTCVTCPAGYTQNEKGQTSW